MKYKVTIPPLLDSLTTEAMSPFKEGVICNIRYIYLVIYKGFFNYFKVVIIKII